MSVIVSRGDGTRRRASRLLRCAVLLAFGALTPVLSAKAAPPPASPPPPEFEPPPVSDPLLLPPRSVSRQIRSWEEALNLIRTRSPDYISNYENVVRAEAQSRIALAAVLPTLNGQGSYTHQFLTETIPLGGANIVTPPPNVLAAGAILNWAVVNPRGIYGVGTANRNVEAVKLSFADRRREITLAVVDAMLASLTAERVAELNRSGLRASLERLVLAETRLRYGQGTPLDVDRGQQDVAAARAQIISGDESLEQAREELGRALGSATPLGAPVDLDLEKFERAVASTCRLNEDIEQRPDVASARKRLEVAERTIHDAELQLSPTLNFVSQANYATAVTLGPHTTWNVQGVLNVPLYDGGARYGARRDSIAATEQARQALVLARLNAIVAARRAHRSVSVSQASREVALAERDLALRIDGRTREGYARGFGTSLDLVISAQALRQAEINLVLQEFLVGKARADAVLASAECLY